MHEHMLQIWISQNLPPQEEWRGGGGEILSPKSRLLTCMVFFLWVTMVNNLTCLQSFDEEANNGLVSIVFTNLFPYMSILTLTSDLQNQ